MTQTTTALATARRNVVQRITRFIESLEQAPGEPYPWRANGWIHQMTPSTIRAMTAKNSANGITHNSRCGGLPKRQGQSR